ncbi:MAG: TldD/PmbA family protein [Treponema sp.]|nr:TldD/PmbA family protein [Treponema sp.]
MLEKSLVHDTLTAALATGGDFAELFVEDNKRNNISMVNGVVERSQSGIDYGAGLRIFNGFNAVYAYTNDTSRENLLKMAKEAAAAIKKDKINGVKEFTALNFDNAHPVKVPFNTVEKKRIVTLVKEASSGAMDYDALITQTTGTYLDTTQDVLIANSEGLWAEDRRTRTRLQIQAVASSATEKQSGGKGLGMIKGFELYDGVDLKKIGREAAETAVTMLKADLCPGGKMPVIIGDAFGGVIFHEACGHSLEATSVARNASVFCGKLGQKVASDKVTAIDDGTMISEWGSINIDDEGSFARKNVLIENGILKTYLIDRLNGLRMGMATTGSCRRESYRFAPTSRMTNTYIAAGNDEFEDMVSSIDLGIYCKKMGGGSVNPGTGEFNFAVTESWMIRGGKIAEPVRGATLIGKGHEILLGVTHVGKHMTQDNGMCGSISGSVPANCGQPHICVDEILVGGRK